MYPIQGRDGAYKVVYDWRSTPAAAKLDLWRDSTRFPYFWVPQNGSVPFMFQVFRCVCVWNISDEERHKNTVSQYSEGND